MRAFPDAVLFDAVLFKARNDRITVRIVGERCAGLAQFGQKADGPRRIVCSPEIADNLKITIRHRGDPDDHSGADSTA
ncbi:hypothetical protein GCM10010833_27770 [Blastomonas aquatica]|uniref:Uncharacterized protein n=1 Tax=Blastomonas aquatica TaxID=1510276 RepID=A0ABQ1JK23_9SPHN|nr:hypothetical protein GCM10010833_27770 [Blastomonas aquatica]